MDNKRLISSMDNNLLFSLRQEMIVNILVNLPIQELVSLQETFPFINSQSFKIKYLAKRNVVLHVPTEMPPFVSVNASFTSGNRVENQEEVEPLQDPSREKRSATVRFLGEFNGVVCVLYFGGLWERVLLWNPNTAEVSEIPAPLAVDALRILVYGFGAGPGPRPFLMVASAKKLAIFRFQSNRWDYTTALLPCARLPGMFLFRNTVRGAFVHDNIYWLSPSSGDCSNWMNPMNPPYDRILAFSICEERFYEVRGPPPPPDEPDLKFMTHLTNLQGKLSVIYSNADVPYMYFYVYGSNSWAFHYRIFTRPPPIYMRPFPWLLGEGTAVVAGSSGAPSLFIVKERHSRLEPLLDRNWDDAVQCMRTMTPPWRMLTGKVLCDNRHPYTEDQVPKEVADTPNDILKFNPWIEFVREEDPLAPLQGYVADIPKNTLKIGEDQTRSHLDGSKPGSEPAATSSTDVADHTTRPEPAAASSTDVADHTAASTDLADHTTQPEPAAASSTDPADHTTRPEPAAASSTDPADHTTRPANC